MALERDRGKMEGKITPGVIQAPNVMWGTNGARGLTVEEGWGLIFVAVEHWNAECVGWHVCKQRTRFKDFCFLLARSAIGLTIASQDQLQSRGRCPSLPYPRLA